MAEMIWQASADVRLPLFPFGLQSFVCPYCQDPADMVSAHDVDAIVCHWADGNVVEEIPERVYVSVEPCGHRTYEDTPGVWVLAECKRSDIGRHVWRDDCRRIVPVEQYCASCGERRDIPEAFHDPDKTMRG